MDAADIPTKQDAVRSSTFARVADPIYDWVAAEFNALRDGILNLRGAGGPLITVDVQTLNATPTLAMAIPIPTGKMFKIRIELVAADASGAGSGGGEIQIFGVNVGGTPAGFHTFGDDHSFTGSMAAVVNPTFSGAAGALQVLVTGVAATTINWLLVATVRPLRSLT